MGAFAAKRIDKTEGVTLVQEPTLRWSIKEGNAATLLIKTEHISRKRLSARCFTTKVYYEWENAQCATWCNKSHLLHKRGNSQLVKSTSRCILVIRNAHWFYQPESRAAMMN